MGSIYRRTAPYCATCKRRLSTTTARDACQSVGHVVEDRESPLWTIQYQDATGRTKAESSKSSNKDKARHLLKLREGAIARGERLVLETLSYEDALTMVVTDYEANEQSSVKDALGRIRHLTPFFTGMKLAQITTATIRDYQKRRLTEERIVSRARTVLHDDGTVTLVPEVRRKPSNAQINRETAMLRRMFSLAKEDDKIVTIPTFPHLDEPKQPKKGFFEYPEFVKVRHQLDPKFRNVAAFMYVTGWRIKSEVLALCWHHVDFAAGEVRLDAGTTKSGEPRVFPFTTDLHTLLHAQWGLTERLKSNAVFCHLRGGRAGQRLSYGGFFKAWLRAGRAAGVTRVPHDFRRTAIRNLERDGVPRSVAMAMVGHQTEEVYTRYAIVDEAMMREAAVKMNRGAKVRRSTAQAEQASAAR